MSRRNRQWENVPVVLLVIVTCAGALYTCGAVSDKADEGAKPGGEATRALETYGFTNVRITSHDSFGASTKGCSGSDSIVYEATATNPAGRRVDMIVCCGWMVKACTVRTR